MKQCYVTLFSGGEAAMEDDLISKKELLTLTGISYGQLYRWKRKGLIPEDWFIRRSTYTGQETFFPRGKILERINKITNMKDDVSLDELADVFSPNTGKIRLTPEQIAEKEIAGSVICGIYSELYNQPDYGFDDMTCIMVLDELLNSGGVNREEAVSALSTLKSGMEHFEDGFCELFALRKLGVFTCFASSTPCDIFFGDGLHIIARISVPAVSEKLKLKLL